VYASVEYAGGGAFHADGAGSVLGAGVVGAGAAGAGVLDVVGGSAKNLAAQSGSSKFGRSRRLGQSWPLEVLGALGSGAAGAGAAAGGGVGSAALGASVSTSDRDSGVNAVRQSRFVDCSKESGSKLGHSTRGRRGSSGSGSAGSGTGVMIGSEVTGSNCGAAARKASFSA
jgi:hypothetical protein